MDFGKAFSFVFDDQEWIKKVLIAGLIMLIPIIGPLVVAGWGYEVTRRVINRDAEPLPDWSDFGGYLGKGFQVFVLGFVYALPLILIQGCIQGGVALGQNQYQDNAVTTAVTVVSLCVGCISFLYAIFMGFTLPAAIGNFAAKEKLSAGFRFGEVFGLVKAAPGAYLIVLLGGLVSSLVASIGVIACAVGVLFTAAYATAINSHLTGQAYVNATGSSELEELVETTV